MTDAVSPGLRDIAVGLYDEMRSRERIVLEIEGKEVGIYFLGDEIRAWHNHCPHQGGPVCQGKILPRTIQKVGPDKKSLGLGFSETERNIVCPWHGFEFDILTGRHPSHDSMRLRAVPVRVENGSVIVSV